MADQNTDKLVATSQALLPFIESLPDAVVIVNASHQIVLANTRAAEMFGHDIAAMMGSDLKMIIPAHHRKKHTGNVTGYFKTPHARPMGAEKRFSGLRADGTEVPVDIMINELTLDGSPVAMALVRDVTYQRALEDRLTLESLTDEMTGFYNRKHFKNQLKAHYSGFVRSGLPASVIMFDFDHFKAINDRFGHAGGDMVLVKVAEMIQRELRPTDMGCRIGGEEFAIMLPNTSLEKAVALAERIRQRTEAMEFRHEDTSFHATITVGVASFSKSDTSHDSLMRKADSALYAGKASGRNCVRVTRNDEAKPLASP